MPYDLQKTAGGNGWLGPNGTFAQIVDGLKAIALNRDNLDQSIREAATTGDQQTLSSAKTYADTQDTALLSTIGWMPLDPSTGYVAAYVDANGKISEFALTTGGVVPTWVVERWAARMGMEQLESGTGYSVAFTDATGKIGELCLDENGRIPDWVIARIGARLGTTGGYAGLVHQVREDEFTQTMGVVSTGGKGAVALRFDHGLANFDTKIRPLLEARNLPYSLVLNSRAWGLAENAGVDAGVVNHWVNQGLAEVWNHGTDHSDHPVEELEEVIAQGKAELEAQLPAAKIWGFAPAGVGAGGYGGFNGGPTPESFGTTAGGLILEHHAVAAGYIPGTAHRVLDGRPRIGSAHYTLDTAAATSSAGPRTQINAAISNKTGLQLMMHPSALDGSGRVTTEILTEVLDYIVAKRDADQIKVLSPYQLTIANAQIGA